MANPCCAGKSCGCALSAGANTTVTGSPATGWVVSADPETVTTVVDNGDGTLTYTNEAGATVTWFDGEHYSVDVAGELSGDTPIPNVTTGSAVYGAANPLTVTIVNPSLVHPMSVHTQGTGEEVIAVGVRTVAASQFATVWCVYSLNGAPGVLAKTGGAQAQFALTSGELRSFNVYTAAPVFVATVPPGASWFVRVTERRYQLSGVLNAGLLASQGQRIVVSGSTTI